MDEKMRKAFHAWISQQPSWSREHGWDSRSFDRVIEWTLNYLREQQEPVCYARVAKAWDGNYAVVACDSNWPTSFPLYALPVPSAPAVPEGWLSAVDTEMITTYLGVANSDDDYETARKKLGQIIDWHVAVALDPAVNGGWKLVPVEPTAEMLVQGAGWAEGTAYETYKGMLDAAPSPDEKETDND